jgi:hypothetical protein
MLLRFAGFMKKGNNWIRKLELCVSPGEDKVTIYGSGKIEFSILTNIP